MSNAVPAKKLNRIQQLRETYRMARRTDKWIGVLTLGAFLLGVAVVLRSSGSCRVKG